MVEARPFRSFEYDASKVDLSAVAAPPFDVIDAELAKKLSKKSAYNVVNLTLVGPKKTDAAYQKVASRLDAWTQEGVLRRHEAPVVYAYEVRYDMEGQQRRMRGVLGLIRLDAEYRQVIPHERVFEKQVEERLKLWSATAWDLEPIELLYPGASAETALWAYIDGGGRMPDLVFTGHDGAQHLYWRVVDDAIIGTVQDGLKGRKAYIADGHHRYATAVKYAQLRRSSEYRPPRDAPYEFKMCVLVNLADAGLDILPTHRIVVKPSVKSPAKVLEALKPRFDVTRLDPGKDVAGAVRRALAVEGNPRLALWFGAKGGLWSLVARDATLAESVAAGHTFGWRSLDVAFLQLLVVRDAFGVPQERWGDDVRYTQDWKDAVSSAGTKHAVAAVFHRPVRKAQFRAVVEAGEVMPQKSTYFVPKLLSGAAFYRIGKELAGRPKRGPSS